MNYPIGGLPHTTLGSSHLPKPVPIITKDIWNIFQIVSLPLLRCSLKTLHTIFWLEARVSCFLPMKSLLSMEQRNLGLPRIGVEVLKGIKEWQAPEIKTGSESGNQTFLTCQMLDWTVLTQDHLIVKVLPSQSESTKSTLQMTEDDIKSRNE